MAGLYDDLVAPSNAYADLIPAGGALVAPAHQGLYDDLVSNSGGPVDLDAPAPNVWAGPGKLHTLWSGTYDVPQWVDRALSGAGRGMVHTARSVGNLVHLVPDSTLQDEKQYDTQLMQYPSAKVGNAVGEAAATVPLAMGATEGVGALGALGARAAASPILNSAIQGAVQGAATADPGERLSNAALGAGTGGALAAAGGLAGKVVNGLTKSPAAARLIDQGVQLTPGQLRPRGFMNQFELASESLPMGAGTIVTQARDAAEQSWQQRVIQSAAAPGAAIKPSGNVADMLQQAYDSFAPLYDQAKGISVKPAVMIPGTRGGVKLSYLFDQATQAPGTTADAQDAARSFLNNELTRLPASPQSDDLLTLRSNIRAAARKAKLSTDTLASDKAAIYDLADQQVTNALNSQLPPDAAGALANADSQYGTYKIVENAVAASKDSPHGLTPQKLSAAIYNATQDPAYARGAGGPLRQLAQDAGEVFQTVSPPTGARVATLGAGALAAATHPFVTIPAATGMLGLTGSQLGRRFAAGITAPQLATQRLVQALTSGISPTARTVGGQFAGRLATGAAMPYVAPTSTAALAAALLMKPKWLQLPGVQDEP